MSNPQNWKPSDYLGTGIIKRQEMMSKVGRLILFNHTARWSIYGYLILSGLYCFTSAYSHFH